MAGLGGSCWVADVLRTVAGLVDGLERRITGLRRSAAEMLRVEIMLGRVSSV